MDLGQYAQTSPALRHLWQSTRYFIQLDERLKAILPANLREHCRVACVQNGVLVVFAKNNMAASRLKMMLPALLPQIQDLGDEIGKIDVKMLPETPKPPREKHCHFSPNVLDMFEHTAQQVAHAPALAQALRNLVAQHRS
ncbi:DUF721 domain-containing protein [Alysiella filiformis]|uniref:DUF721 domain-containing protein n=1 Tax=Alysiella filiformis DSM 16848 TaxID=1120981 RepID=A0A286E9A0_9NEIS|nr:DUF721 domain-containing protein [Alysiella filiformis]QMT31438.1 DUF721 domain-containing protein [Alysiella filiformis]UBQ55551.1 DUF721 domain-containing protein [Alysiella filiformis DSM 16848]SOD67471.1 Protein of unknown function [Alysiella filiformis DSM 16848]